MKSLSIADWQAVVSLALGGVVLLALVFGFVPQTLLAGLAVGLCLGFGFGKYRGGRRG